MALREQFCSRKSTATSRLIRPGSIVGETVRLEHLSEDDFEKIEGPA